MKQLLVMVLATCLGTFGSCLWSPLYGVYVYYAYSIFAPQYLWEWSLPPGIRWSFYVAIVTLCVVVFERLTGSGSRDLKGNVRHWHPKINAGHWFVVAYAMWFSLCYLLGEQSERSTTVFQDTWKCFAMYGCAAAVLATVSDLWKLLLVVIIAMTYVAYEANFVYLAEGRMDIYNNGFAGIDNNGIGLVLATGVPILYSIWETTKGPGRWVAVAFLPVVLHAVLLTYSRGAWVALLAACPLIIWNSRHRLRTLLSGLAFAAIVLPILAGDEIRKEFDSTFETTVDASAQSRFESWRIAVRMIGDHPVFGFGVRNSMIHMSDYGLHRNNRAIHNQFLQIAADNGIVGLFFYMGALIYAWSSCANVARMTRRRTDTTGRHAYTISVSTSNALFIFAVGALFLSIETVELQFILILIGSQLRTVADLQSNPNGQDVEGCAQTTIASGSIQRESLA